MIVWCKLSLKYNYRLTTRYFSVITWLYVQAKTHNIHGVYTCGYLLWFNTSTWMLWIFAYTYCHVVALKLHNYIPEFVTLLVCKYNVILKVSCCFEGILLFWMWILKCMIVTELIIIYNYINWYSVCSLYLLYVYKCRELDNVISKCCKDKEVNNLGDV